MKIRKPLLSIILVAINSGVFAQTWKEYSDSAKIYFRKNDFLKAENYYTYGLEKVKKDSAGTLSLADYCYDFADFYFKSQNFTAAKSLLLKSKQIQEKILGTKDTNYAHTCSYLGNTYRMLGQYGESELMMLEAKQIREEKLGKKSHDYAASCFNLAILYKQIGRLQKAELLYLEAKLLNEELLGKESVQYAYTCNNLGNVYFDLHQYEKAELLYREAMTIRKTLVDKKIITRQHSHYTQSLNNLAGLYAALKLYEKCEPLALEAREIRAIFPGKNSHSYAQSCDNLGLLYTNLGQYDKAEIFYFEAKEVWEKNFAADHPEILRVQNNLGLLYTLMGIYEKAEPLLLGAKKNRESLFGKNSSENLYSCNNLSYYYWNAGKDSLAEWYFKELISCQQNLTKINFDFLNETEKEYYLEGETSFTGYFFSFCFLENKYRNSSFFYDNMLFSRSTILSSALQLRQAINSSPDTILIRKYSEWTDWREQLASTLTKPVIERKGREKELEDKANNLEKELTRISSAFKKNQETQEIKWKDIQQSLKPGEAAIEFADFKFFDKKRWTDSTYYIALVLRKDKQEPEMVKLFEKKVLDSGIRVTKSLDEEKTINLRYAHNNSLYKVIWHPLEKYLQGVTKIYFAPSGMLHKIPFATLAINDKERLIDKYKLVQLNSTATVVNPSIESISSTDKLHLYGGILYDGDTTALKQAAVQLNIKDVASRSLPDDLDRGNIWGYLEESKKEVESIEKLALQKNIIPSLYTGWDATEESIKSLNGKNSPSVLHIATHGFFLADPKKKLDNSIATEGKVFRQSDNPMMRSGLTMAGANYAWDNKPVEGIQDGILTAYEVSNMYLPNTKLAVLSACETGLGDIHGNEGVYGLQRAFKIAGVKNLIMSLWKVPDSETAEFMTVLYKKLFTGESIEESFYHTQTEMKNKYRNEPYKWAAWILVR